ncbi:uncharacterized protein [Cherax quadricarinatus]|uniref:uncharacterized protein n=1 Tax=Cherax quadricarinatus TaxID=27406 RepID=UPI00387E83F7
MERLLKPERLDCDPSLSTAAQEWKHWFKTFENFLGALPKEDLDKLSLLINFAISECNTYEDAIKTLKSQYIKPTNEIFAHYLLATRRQQIDESLEEYLQALKILGKDCHFQAVTAAQYCEESIRDAFISGLQSPIIRQRLLENKTLDLAAAFDQARALDSAQKNSEVYSTTQPSRVVSAAIPDQDSCNEVTVEPASVTAAAGTVYFFCGFSRHPRPKCPAREAMCHKCHKKGHFPKVCHALKSRNLPVQHWQTVLPDALHSIRSLLCTATNATPHERLLNYSRRSSTGASVPTWLCHPGPVLLKSHRRMNKTDPLVEEEELLQANPHYAHIRYHNCEFVTFVNCEFITSVTCSAIKTLESSPWTNYVPL